MGADALGIDTAQDTETVCMISLQALSDHFSAREGSPSVHQIEGFVQGHPVNMLIDSGNTASFLNNKLGSSLYGITGLLAPIRVKVADDRQLRCTQEIRECSWTVHGLEFVTDFKLLQLGMFDAILGQDWLYKHSPMYIDWPTKRLEISDNRRPVYLQGVGATEVICQHISVQQLSGLHQQGDIEQILVAKAVTNAEDTDLTVPAEVQSILDQYSDVFVEPAVLPPRHACDHQIQLIEGAQPV
jgi:hypothetical protein